MLLSSLFHHLLYTSRNNKIPATPLSHPYCVLIVSTLHYHLLTTISFVWIIPNCLMKPTSSSCLIHTVSHRLDALYQFCNTVLIWETTLEKGNGKSKAKTVSTLKPMVLTPELEVLKNQTPTCGQRKTLTETSNTMPSNHKKPVPSLPDTLTLMTFQ